MVIDYTTSPITEKKLVAVEGVAECKFLTALCRQMNLRGIQVQPLKGKYDWPTKLRTLVGTPGFSDVVSFGIMRDADTDAKGAFESVCNALRSQGLAVPRNPLSLAQGAEGNPSVVVLILPHGSRQGMLEDVCLQGVVDDPAMECVDDYFKCLSRKLKTLPKNLSKARVHTFLSSREESDLRLGEAAEKGYWPWQNPAFDCFRQFLSML